MAAAAAGAAVTAVKALRDTLQSRKGGSSARSCGVVVRNLTSKKLLRGHSGLSHGVWTSASSPPDDIESGKLGGFMMESNGLMTGCEGDANYDIVGTSAVLKMHMNNPFSGSNSYNIRVEGDSTYTVDREGGDGNNAYITVTLRGGPPPDDEEAEGGEEEGGDEEGGNEEEADEDEDGGRGGDDEEEEDNDRGNRRRRDDEDEDE